MRRAIVGLLLLGLVACGGSGSDPDDGPDAQYRVSGSTTSVDVTYANASEGTSQQTVAIPWTYDIADATSGQFLYISAQNNNDSGSVTVQIYKNGTLYRESTSAGAFVIATADGTY